MIYRIICSNLESPPRLMGAWVAGADGTFALNYPDSVHPRARFYFTERGWRTVGVAIARATQARGRVVRVIRRKNPPKSLVTYQDDLQVAVLPVDKLSGRRRMRLCSSKRVRRLETEPSSALECGGFLLMLRAIEG